MVETDLQNWVEDFPQKTDNITQHLSTSETLTLGPRVTCLWCREHQSEWPSGGVPKSANKSIFLDLHFRQWLTVNTSASKLCYNCVPQIQGLCCPVMVWRLDVTNQCGQDLALWRIGRRLHSNLSLSSSGASTPWHPLACGNIILFSTSVMWHSPCGSLHLHMAFTFSLRDTSHVGYKTQSSLSKIYKDSISRQHHFQRCHLDTYFGKDV